MDAHECDLINSAINDIPSLREGFYLSSFLIQPHIFHINRPSPKNQREEHSHSTFELSMVLEGRISYHVDGYDFTLSAGDMVIIPPTQKHYWTLHDLNTIVFGYMCFISGKGIHPLSQLNRLLDAIKARRYYIRHFEAYANRVKDIVALFSQDVVFREDEARSLQKLSYIYMFRNLLPDWKDAEKPSKHSTRGMSHEQLIEQVKYYIYDNLSRPISLTDLTRHLGVSKDHLNRLFKKSEGVSIGRFIANTKIGEASKTLVISNDSVKTIAWRFGFADVDYFSYAFKQITGKTPTEFRKTNRAREI